jgi:hypothetical protein
METLEEIQKEIMITLSPECLAVLPPHSESQGLHDRFVEKLCVE